MGWPPTTTARQQYLDLEPSKGLLHEVACAAAFDDGRIVLDIFCSAGADGTFAAQALYHRDSPLTQISLNTPLRGLIPYRSGRRHDPHARATVSFASCR